MPWWSKEEDSHWWSKQQDHSHKTQQQHQTQAAKYYAVRLVDLDDKEVSVHFPSPSKYAFDKLAGQYQVIRGEEKAKAKTLDTIVMPIEHGIWMKRQRIAPLACAYHATKGVLKNLFGVEFSQEDEAWFLGHGLLQPGGLPMPDTLRVIQGLIAPYNFRVSRVRILPGLAVRGNMLEWRPILGMNPMALADRGTTNAEYAEAVGQPLVQVNNLYRMEYNAEPFTAGVVCEASEKSEHGHASYAAPRRKTTGDELISYQIARVSADPWVMEPPEWPYVEAEIEEVLDIWAMVRREDTEKKERIFELVDDVPATDKSMKLLARVNAGICPMCRAGEIAKDHAMCGSCWSAIWDGYKCPDKYCDAQFYTRPPHYRGANSAVGALEATCSKCNSFVNLGARDDAGARLALRALAGRFEDTDVEEWQFYVEFQKAGAV